jgi:hypothetical protein
VYVPSLACFAPLSGTVLRLLIKSFSLTCDPVLSIRTASSIRGHGKPLTMTDRTNLMTDPWPCRLQFESGKLSSSWDCRQKCSVQMERRMCNLFTIRYLKRPFWNSGAWCDWD